MTTTATTSVEVTYENGEQYVVRDHEVRTDQPRESDGHDLRRGLGATAEYRTASDPPARFAEVCLAVRVPSGMSERRKTALPAVVRHRTVHNTFRRAPEIVIELNEVES